MEPEQGIDVGLFGSNERVAIGLGARRARLLVGRGNGQVKQVFAGSRELPEGALRVGLRGPVINDRDGVVGALRELVGEAKSAGVLRRTPETVALLVADGAFKMAVAPLEGATPGRSDGDRMARWLLRELIPVDESEIRADWSVLEAPGEEGTTSSMLSVGGVDAVMAEYESVVAELGWTVGRLVPWSFAAAAARTLDDVASDIGTGVAVISAAVASAATDDIEEGRRDLVLCDADGALGALFQTDGIPRLHRAWRSPVTGEAVAEELPALRRYVNDHLETSIGNVWLCGDSTWTTAAAAACERNQMPARVLSSEAALCAAIED